MPTIQAIKKVFVEKPGEAVARTLLAAAVAAVATAIIANLATKGRALNFIVQFWATAAGRGVLLGAAVVAVALGAAAFAAPFLLGKIKTVEDLKRSSSIFTEKTADGGIQCSKLENDKFDAIGGELPWRGLRAACKTARANLGKNRYADVMPFDDNLYRMKNRDLAEATPYINASPINGGEYILTQGPMAGKSVDDFWNMVWDSGSACIVMAVDVQMGKCDQYWPGPSSNMETPAKICIALTKSEEQDFGESRRFCLTREKERREVAQIHLKKWTDMRAFGVQKVLKSLEMASSLKGEGPIIVHCSAGLGRSGTWVAMHQLYELDKRYKSEQKRVGVSISNIVKKLREQRYGAVQTEEQYKMIYECAEKLQSRSVE